MKLFNVKILDEFTIDELESMTDEELMAVRKHTIICDLYNYPEFKKKHRRLLWYYFYEAKNRNRKLDFIARSAMYFGVSEQQIVKAMKVIKSNKRFADIDFEEIMDFDTVDNEDSIRLKEYVAAEERFSKRNKAGYFIGAEANEEVYV